MHMNEFLTQLALSMIPALGAALAALITAVVAYVVTLIRAKAGDRAATKATEYMVILQQVATNAVLATQQTVVDVLKREGRWDAAAKAQVKEATVNTAVAALGDLRTQMEAHLRVDVPAYMQLLIERALSDLKTAGTIKPVTPAPALALAPRPPEPVTDLPPTGTDGK